MVGPTDAYIHLSTLTRCCGMATRR
jgi:hypothetical protein